MQANKCFEISRKQRLDFSISKNLATIFLILLSTHRIHLTISLFQIMAHNRFDRFNCGLKIFMRCCAYHPFLNYHATFNISIDYLLIWWFEVYKWIHICWTWFNLVIHAFLGMKSRRSKSAVKNNRTLKCKNVNFMLKTTELENI